MVVLPGLATINVYNHDTLAENIWLVKSNGYITMYYRYGTSSDEIFEEIVIRAILNISH